MLGGADGAVLLLSVGNDMRRKQMQKWCGDEGEEWAKFLFCGNNEGKKPIFYDVKLDNCQDMWAALLLRAGALPICHCGLSKSMHVTQ